MDKQRENELLEIIKQDEKIFSGPKKLEQMELTSEEYKFVMIYNLKTLIKSYENKIKVDKSCLEEFKSNLKLLTQDKEKSLKPNK